MLKEKIEILESSPRRLVLYIEGFPLEYVSALRRISLSEVPTMAIEWVNIYRNDSAMFNEVLAHRLGLLVLRSEEALERYKEPEECRADLECDVDDETCIDGFITRNSECFVRMILNVTHPENMEETRIVRAVDIESEDPDVYPVHKMTEITHLTPGQSLEVEMFARLGRGKEHAKFIPGLAILKYVPVITYDSSKITDECIECISNYSKELAEKISEGSGTIVWKDAGNTSLLRDCAARVCEASGLKIEYTPERLILVIETHGGLTPTTIINQALKELDKKISRVLEELGGA